MELGSFWETAANFATAMTALAVLLTVWYRYKNSTPLEKLFMEGADRVLFQVGTIVEHIGVIFLFMLLFNATGLFLFLQFGIEFRTHQSVFKFTVLFLLLLSLTFSFYKRNSDSCLWDEFSDLLVKISGNSKSAKCLITIFVIVFSSMVELCLLIVFLARIINKSSVTFVLIIIMIDFLLGVIYAVKKMFNKKKKWEWMFFGSSIMGLIVCFMDMSYMSVFAKPSWNCMIRLGFFVIYIAASIWMIMVWRKARRQHSHQPGDDEHIERLLYVFIIGFVIVPFIFRKQWINESLFSKIMEITRKHESMRCKIQEGYTKIPLIYPFDLRAINKVIDFKVNRIVLLTPILEVLFAFWAVSGVKFLEDKIGRQIVAMRIVNLSTGKPWFAYRVYDGQLVYGDDREYKNQSSSHFISMDDVYNGKYAFTDANIEPQEFYRDGIMVKGRVERNIDYVIDVSTKEARRNKGYSFIHPSLFNDTLGEIGDMSISLIKSRVSTKQIDKNSGILVYCEEEERSQVAAWRLIAMGYKSVYIYKFRKDC